MKVSIKFDESDNSDLKTVTLKGGCGTPDELACMFSVIVAATNWDFDAIVAYMLGVYTSESNSPKLYKAVEQWWANHLTKAKGRAINALNDEQE